MNKDVCLISGVGPGTGSALARRFSETHRVAMIARSEDRLKELTEELPEARGYPCDVTDTDALKNTLSTIREEMGAPACLVHNAVGGAFGDILQVDPKQLELNWQINTMALLHLVQSLGPDMVEAGRGVILATGNTSAYRGTANYAAFAPTKAAQRILLESAARHLGPKGVHVAYVAIDAVIDLPWTRQFFPDRPDDFFCKPVDIAGECHRMAQQPRSAWSFDAVIRPFGETW